MHQSAGSARSGLPELGARGRRGPAGRGRLEPRRGRGRRPAPPWRGLGAVPGSRGWWPGRCRWWLGSTCRSALSESANRTHPAGGARAFAATVWLAARARPASTSNEASPARGSEVALTLSRRWRGGTPATGLGLRGAAGAAVSAAGTSALPAAATTSSGTAPAENDTGGPAPPWPRAGCSAPRREHGADGCLGRGRDGDYRGCRRARRHRRLRLPDGRPGRVGVAPAVCATGRSVAGSSARG